MRETKARARATDPPTSHAAAESVNVTRGQSLVLGAFLTHGELSDVGLCAALEGALTDSGARSRRAELVAAGLLRYTGRDVKLPSGRMARVHGLTFGREFYEDLLRAQWAGVDPDEAAEAEAAANGEFCEPCGDHRPGIHPDHAEGGDHA